MGEGLVIAAGGLGKLKTVFQMAGLWALIVHNDGPLGPIDFPTIGTALLLISVALSVLSAADYFRGFFRAMNARQTDRTTARSPA